MLICTQREPLKLIAWVWFLDVLSGIRHGIKAKLKISMQFIAVYCSVTAHLFPATPKEFLAKLTC